MVTKKEIIEFLENCGIKHNDIVTIHISLRAVGEIENGADGLIDAFCEYLCDGLFIVPTHTWWNVNKDNPYFDVRSTVPCIGTLPTVAAFRKDGVRSLHPTHSVTVFGKGAEDYVKGEENSSTPTPMGGALSRLYEENGKVLLIGVGHERNTYLHAVDERIDIPNRLREEGFTVAITDYNGNTIQSPVFHSHSRTPSDMGYSEFFPNYKNALDYAGAVTYSKLGNALVYVCDVQKMTDAVIKLWEAAEYDLCADYAPIPEGFYTRVLSDKR